LIEWSRHDLNITLRISFIIWYKYSLLVQYTYSGRSSLKKFIYLMIDAIKRQNNIRESIESTVRLIELLNDLQLIKYASFISINRISNKEFSLIARESNRSRESINSQIKQQKWLHLLLSSITLCSISSLLKHSFNSISSSFFIMSHFFKECFKASFFIVENNDSFAEIITSSMTMKALKKQCKELKARLQAKEIISSSSIYSEHSRSQKIFNSSLFTDEKNSIWKNWYEKVQNKLKINVDLFSSEWVKLSYVHFRLFNDAAEITQSKRERDCFNSYKIIDELLKELAQLFDDSDKEVNFRRNYYNLIQEQKKFSEFYTQFWQLFFYLDYQEKQLIIDLKNKINSRLQFAWVTQLIQLSTLKKIHFYLTWLNNDQQVIWEIKNREAMIKARIIKQIIFVEESVKATCRIIEMKMIDQSKLHDVVLTNIKENDLLIENYFLCHKSDHTSKECLNRSFRINALNDEFDHSLNFDSESDSKN